MRNVLVVSCTSVLLVLAACSGEKSTPPGGGGGGASGKDRTVNIYNVDATHCGVDAALLVIRNQPGKKDKVKWHSEDDKYRIEFPNGSPFENNDPIKVEKGQTTMAKIPKDAADGLYQYAVYSDKKTPCKEAKPANPQDYDPGLNVKH